jgi:ClpP class serine protease
MTAILNESAYSAAYAIASAAHRVTVPRTGGVGSVGVICMHADYSAAIKDAGIKITVIKYGDKKGDGMAEVKLSGSALEKLQNDVDTMGELFVETVARNRGLGVSKVRGMQAACYLGKEGVDIGLADDIITPHLEFKNSIDAINS